MLNITMTVLKEKYGVCRLDSEADLPAWLKKQGFFSITKTQDELSIVCDQDRIPDDVIFQRDFRMFKVEGPLDFSLIGILSLISSTLAQEEISIFAISTYDTDYILVNRNDLENAIIALQSKGIEIKRK